MGSVMKKNDLGKNNGSSNELLNWVPLIGGEITVN